MENMNDYFAQLGYDYRTATPNGGHYENGETINTDEPISSGGVQGSIPVDPETILPEHKTAFKAYLDEKLSKDEPTCSYRQWKALEINRQKRATISKEKLEAMKAECVKRDDIIRKGMLELNKAVKKIADLEMEIATLKMNSANYPVDSKTSQSVDDFEQYLLELAIED